MTYISLYRDLDGNVFVGEKWEANTSEEFDATLESEQGVINEIPNLVSVEIYTLTAKLNAPDLGD